MRRLARRLAAYFGSLVDKNDQMSATCARKLCLVVTLLVISTTMIYNEISNSQHRIKQETAKINELEAKLQKVTESGAPQNVSLKDQILCAQQAEQAFQSVRPEKGSALHEFISHYQPTSGRCFVEIDDISYPGDGSMATSEMVSDAVGGEVVSNYLASGQTGTERILDCHLTYPDGQTRNCRSYDEFTALNRQYMK